MNKLIGYMTIKVDGEDIPLKYSIGAVRLVLEQYGIVLSELSSIFNYITVKDEDGNDKEVPAAKDPLKFASLVLWAGATFASKVTSGKGYPVEYGDVLLDQVGLTSETLITAYRHFFKAISNGAGAGEQSQQPQKKSRGKR